MAEAGARMLDSSVENLGAQLIGFVEGDGNVWRNSGKVYTPSQRTWISALLACEVCDGYPKPRILEYFGQLQCVKDLVGRLENVSPDPWTFANYRDILRKICLLVPYPLCLSTTLEILKVRFNDQVPSSYISLLELLGAPRMLALPSGDIDAIKAAEQVLLRGTPFIRELIKERILPELLEDLARSAGSRSRNGLPSPRPVEHVARLSGEACALFIYGAPKRFPTWPSVRPLFAHLGRLSEVVGFSHPPTLYPSQTLLGAIRLDEESARAYDQRLLDDARSIFNDLDESEGLSQHAALQKASRKVMSGFHPFIVWLERAKAKGARITSFPQGIAGSYNQLQLYKGARDDLSPRPEIFRQLLGALPELLDGEDLQLGRLVVIQFVTAARASVVLGLDRTCWIEDNCGVLLHVRSGSNKTGWSSLFLAPAWIELFNIKREWLPDQVSEDPANWLRDDFNKLIDRVCRKFEERSGQSVTRKSARFTRSALVQLLRTNLKGNEKEAISALLGHQSRFTRANYWRAWPEEIEAAYARWDNSNLGASYREGK